MVIHRPDELPEDGRAARSYRTIEKILQAMEELLEQEGEPRPTADQVASQAGVSRRALYLHFDSLEGLLAETLQRRLCDAVVDLRPPPSDSPLDVRVGWFSESWSKLLERLLPFSRAYGHYQPQSPELARTFESIRTWMRAVTEGVFQNELSARSEEERALLIVALHYLTSCTAWANVRAQGANPEQAARAMHHLLHNLWQR